MPPTQVMFSYTSPTLSIYALLLNHTGQSGFYFNIEVITFATLLYLSFCTYRVIFKLRIFNFYQLVPHQQTDSARSVRCHRSFSRSRGWGYRVRVRSCGPRDGCGVVAFAHAA
jgi:hypothetical protein